MPKFAIKYKGTSEDESGQTFGDFTQVIIFNSIAIAFSFGIKGLFQTVFDLVFKKSNLSKVVSYLIYNSILFTVLLLMYRGLQAKAKRRESSIPLESKQKKRKK